MRLQIINLREDAAEPADINGLPREFGLADHHRQQRENLLSSSQRKRRDQQRGLTFEHAQNRLDEPLNFPFARETRYELAGPARGFHD